MRRLGWTTWIVIAGAVALAGAEGANATRLGGLRPSAGAARTDVHQAKCRLFWWRCGVPPQYIPQGPPVYGAPSPQPYVPPQPQKPIKFPKFPKY